MKNISIKVHPPWYARGTPVINTRDGPPMALSDKPLFANPITIGCRGPSARGNPTDFIRLWLTYNLTVFNTQNSVYGQGYADLSACVAPDNVKQNDIEFYKERIRYWKFK
jgi:hypothetical protein